jgi:feruloyl esterase
MGGVSPIGLMEDILTALIRFETDFNVEEYDPAEDRDQIAGVTTPLDVRSGDLSEFGDRGGKLLMYQGWNDFPLRPQRAFNYLAAVDRATGGPERTGEFLRLFMVPGMVHCAGGPGPWQADYVDAIVRWTEEGEAPERIIGTHPADAAPMDHLSPGETQTESESFTRPLCVYPKLGLYNGEGDPNEADSFRCAVP